ncbi:MAG: hypothetical protein AB7F74_26845, partial [Parvibaculaceae bacterium]
ETEQSERAGRLERLGLARVVREERLSSESLAEAMLGAPEPAACKLNLEGARETARLVSQRFAALGQARSLHLKY